MLIWCLTDAFDGVLVRRILNLLSGHLAAMLLNVTSNFPLSKTKQWARIWIYNLYTILYYYHFQNQFNILSVAAFTLLGRETCTRSGRCSVLLAPLVPFINAAITGDSSAQLFLPQCHLLSLESYWKCLHVPSSCVPPSFFCPVFWRLSLSLSPNTFFSLFADSTSISLSPLCSAVFCFLRHFCSCLSAAVSCCHSSFVRACRHQRRYQTGCPLRLHKVTWNARWEKKCQGGTSTS